MDLLRHLLGELGPLLLGVTPLGQRYESIQTFLASWSLLDEGLQIGVTDYRSLDDMAEEFPQEPARPNSFFAMAGQAYLLGGFRPPCVSGSNRARPQRRLADLPQRSLQLGKNDERKRFQPCATHRCLQE